MESKQTDGLFVRRYLLVYLERVRVVLTGINLKLLESIGKKNLVV